MDTGDEVLLEFRAGRMQMLGSTVRPDPRKGILRIARGGDLLLHVQWLDRTHVPIRLEEDIIVFPDEAIFKKVGQSGGRVYLLEFLQDDRRFFFWMQEPDASRDEQLCIEVNQRINEGLADEDDEEGEGEGEGGLLEMEGGDGDSEDMEEAEEEDLGREPRPADLVAAQNPPAAPSAAAAAPATQPGMSLDWSQTLGIPGVTPTSQAAAAALAASLQMGHLRSLVSGLSSIPIPPEALAASSRGMIKEPGLTELLSPQLLLPQLTDPQVLERLRPHLPPALQSQDQMQQLLQSPQFHQQLDTLSLLLRSGRIDLAQFGIDANKHGYGVLSFLRAIQEQTPLEAAVGERMETEGQGAKEPVATEGAASDKGEKGGEQEGKQIGSTDATTAQEKQEDTKGRRL